MKRRNPTTTLLLLDNCDWCRHQGERYGIRTNRRAAGYPRETEDNAILDIDCFFARWESGLLCQQINSAEPNIFHQKSQIRSSLHASGTNAKIYQIFMAQFKSSTAKFDARFAVLIVDPPICPTSVLHSRMAHCNTKQNKHGFSMRDCRMFPVILNVLLCPLSFMISPKFWKCTRCKMYRTWSGIPWSLQNAGWRTRSNAMITRELDVTRCSSSRPGWNPCCSSGRSAFKNWSRRPSGRHAAVIVEYVARHASHAVPWSCRSASCSWFCRNVGLSLPWRQCSPMSMRFLKRFFNASQNERYAKSLYPIHRANVYSQ